MADFARLEEENKQAVFAFLKTDLHAGITFAKLALAASDPEKTNRNRDNARKADEAVRRFIDRVQLTENESAELQSLQNQLAKLLLRLDAKA